MSRNLIPLLLVAAWAGASPAAGAETLTVTFRTQDTGIICGDESATLTGELLDGTAIEGTDSIQTVGCRAGRRSIFARPGEDRLRQLPGSEATTPQRK